MIKEPDMKSLPVLTLEIPSGESPNTYFEGYLGALPTPSAEMPSEADVEATVFIELK